MTDQSTESKSVLLGKWHRRVSKAVDAHYESARHFSKRHIAVGLSLIIFSAMVPFFLSTSIYDKCGSIMKIVISIFGLLTFALALAQTFLRDAERAYKHKITAAKYAAVRRDIEKSKSLDNVENNQKLDMILHRIDALAEEAPEIPGHIWRNTQLAFKGHGTVDGKQLPE